MGDGARPCVQVGESGVASRAAIDSSVELSNHMSYQRSDDPFKGHMHTAASHNDVCDSDLPAVNQQETRSSRVCVEYSTVTD